MKLIIAGILATVSLAFAARVRVENHTDGEVIRYPVPLLRGSADGVEKVVVECGGRKGEWPVFKGRFKAMVELSAGENLVVVKAGEAEERIKINYKPQTNPYFVRCIYLTDSTGETAYQSQLENDPQNYAEKLDTAMKLMQTFTAERMNDLGFGRVTFNLELDEKGKVVVHTVKGSGVAADYYALNDQAWWGRVARELEPKWPTKRAKNFVVAAYSRFDPATKKTKGHTALGGGGLGLFGSGNLFTWPNSIADVPRAFGDGTRIDNTRVQDDSAGRGTFWGAASTTIGASLHETSHAFGLPHTKEPEDIMTRGFDHFNRVFVMVEPGNHEFKDERVACFPPISAAALAPNRYFALDTREWKDGNAVKVKVEGAEVVVESQRPLRYVGVSVKGDAIHFVAPKEGTVVKLALEEIRKVSKGEVFDVRTVDEEGNMTFAGKVAS